MPFEIEIISEEKLVNVRAFGRIHTDLFKRILLETISNDQLYSTYGLLVNLTNVQGSPIVDDSTEVLNILRTVRKAFRGKVAVVVMNQAVLTIARLVSLLAAKEHILFEAFEDIEKAKTWLKSRK